MFSQNCKGSKKGVFSGNRVCMKIGRQEGRLEGRQTEEIDEINGKWCFKPVLYR